MRPEPPQDSPSPGNGAVLNDEDSPPKGVEFRCRFCKNPHLAEGFLADDGLFERRVALGQPDPLAREVLHPACRYHFDHLPRKRRIRGDWRKVPLEEGKRLLWREHLQLAVKGVLES